jgi:hypothetical protein
MLDRLHGFRGDTGQEVFKGDPLPGLRHLVTILAAARAGCISPASGGFSRTASHTEPAVAPAFSPFCEVARGGSGNSGRGVFRVSRRAVGSSESRKVDWSIDPLVEANRLFDTLSSIVAVDRGRLVLAWGDYGAGHGEIWLSFSTPWKLERDTAPVRDGRINLDDTLEHLGIETTTRH